MEAQRMKYDAFLGEVQHRLELATEGDAARAARIVLETLGQRIGEGEASDLASQLPREIGRHLTKVEGGEQFSYQVFIERIAERAEIDESDANYYAQAIAALVADCVQGGELAQVRAQLPDDYDDLFELVDAKATPW
ncbi:DUF2267 domain-containing protein [Haloplanus halobius]|uniref:DUF2267 domain-containing protein n=1 Tax=Haloplanus halobius TaxID=2934938 RepID=UPI00200E897D|nr:DUF2267 domain-containing protein [Haloplanus sp. XH21]